MKTLFILISVLTINSHFFAQANEKSSFDTNFPEYTFGAYLSFEEFKTNNPSILNIVVNEKGNNAKPQEVNSSGDRQRLKDKIWGYSDGNKVYVSANSLPGVVGNTYFELHVDIPYSIPKTSIFYVLNMETGKIKALELAGGWSIFGFKRLYAGYRDLYKQYKEERRFLMRKQLIIALKSKYVLLLNEELRKSMH